MNKKVKIIAATLAVGMTATLAGCGGCFGCAGCSSCGGDSASNSLTRSNWFAGTSYNGIQPSFIEGHENFSKEIVNYAVTYDKESSDNDFVELNYKDGTFTTEFYATRYDWTSSSIPEGYADEKVKTEVVYYYRTELKIKVQYTMKKTNEAPSKWFEDHVVTESYFRAAGKHLKPVYSKQEIVSTSPANYQPGSMKEAYEEINVTYENFYNYNCTKVLSKTTENGETTEKAYGKLNKLDYSLFDNSSLYIVARSMLKPSSSPSETVALFSAAAGGIDSYSISGSSTSLSDDERKSYTDILEGAGLYVKGENDEGVETAAVSISYAGGNLRGTSQKVWYAAVTSENKDNNVSRATMLKLSVPLSFSLGTLNYSLISIDSTLWDDKN